ncbi:MAG: hypothetical protein PVF58_10555 [Candidatus Methanofastidiosia archaeon]|jgi:hypothetical protein
MSKESEPFWPLVTVTGVIGIAVFVISVSVNWWGGTVVRSGLVTALVLMLVADIQMVRYHIKKKAYNIPASDERLDKIVVYASAYAFRVGIFFMIVLIFLDLLHVLNLGTVVALCVSVFVMAGVYFVFHVYYNKKGDVIR